VPVIVIDANIEGQCSCIWMRLQSDVWREFTTALDVTFQTLAEAGLDPASSDDVIWRFCQANGHFLLTSNRNQEAEDSLETTIRREGTATSLPVFTLPNPDNVYQSDFLERVVEKLFDYVLNADNIRGTGRLYLP